MIKTFELTKDLILHPSRALFIKSHETLIIGDLHIGIEESELIGFRVQTKEMLERALNLIDFFKAKKIIINGDIKHSFARNYEQAELEIKLFFNVLSKKVEVIIIKGNHDNYLQNILKEKFNILENIKLGDYFITHGHKFYDWKKQNCKKVIIANEHPVIILRDEVETYVKLPCFLIFNNLIVIPAFNPLSGGANFLSIEKPLSENYFKNKDFLDAKVYAINEDEILFFKTLKEIKNSIKNL